MDRISPQARLENMRRIKSVDTKPEMIVRSVTHRAGYRYTLYNKKLAGKPDLVFPSRRKIIFVHGCFWHQHDAQDCLDGRRPKSNCDYWDTKLTRNVERDQRNLEELVAEGWDVLTVWECETKSKDTLRSKIVDFLQPAKTGAQSY